ncbi:MAG: response regulator transcription factor, partial [Clostridia bacterium]|nr:response regulator transcription factor [Clostridia bacterium]
VTLCKQETFDAVVMDIMMPELDGFSACREIRKSSSVPILLLSARGEEYDKIIGFEFGADDYVVKPFSPRELMLRVEAILKRVGNGEKEMKPVEEGKSEVYTYKDLTVDFTARIVTIEGKVVSLSPKEYDLLFYFVRNRNIALSREKLICDVWGYDFYGSDRTLDTHVKLLRKSIGKYSECVVTLRGMGYRFDAP